MYESVEIDTELLEAVEERTNSFEERDEWIENATHRYLQRNDLPERPDLDRDEYRARLVEDAIKADLKIGKPAAETL